jgi:hypothetical protein
VNGETLVALARGIAPVVRDYVTKSHADLKAQISDLQIAEQLIGDLVKANADLKSRVDFLEARPVAIGLRYRKTWQPDTAYDAGDVVTCAGSGWVCDAATTAKPGDSKDWTLFVKRGRDGKDGKA